LACLKNTNLAVIKYLIEEHRMDINHINWLNNNCLILACYNNNNLAVIKYLEEHKRGDVKSGTS
jgi:ankyrin repeat protein